MDKKETFFMVYVEGESSPTYKHLTIESADTEAKRLAKLLNKKVYVLCTIKSFELNEFKVNDCRPENDDLPF